MEALAKRLRRRVVYGESRAQTLRWVGLDGPVRVYSARYTRELTDGESLVTVTFVNHSQASAELRRVVMRYLSIHPKKGRLLLPRAPRVHGRQGNPQTLVLGRIVISSTMRHDWPYAIKM